MLIIPYRGPNQDSSFLCKQNLKEPERTFKTVRTVTVHLSPYNKSTFSLGAAAQMEVGREGEGKISEKNYRQHDMWCPQVGVHGNI